MSRPSLLPFRHRVVGGRFLSWHRVAFSALLALVAACFVTTSAHAQVSIDWVTVGDPNNAADPLTGYGSVDHEYQIGKYEVTIWQYTTFLNAVDPNGTNPYGLYNNSMGTDHRIKGILFTSGATSGSKYSPMGSSDRPISYVNWFDAARFANWMHNGQGSGSTETGAYTLVGGQTSGTAPAKNSGAQFYIPTENEWYKAAYFSPVLNSGSGGYYAYATQNNTAPGNIVGAAANQANYVTDGKYAVTQAPFMNFNLNYLTDKGAFTNSASYYGTFDQNGNVWEWNDRSGTPSVVRGLGGGMWSQPFFLSSSALGSGVASGEMADVGFRLASGLLVTNVQVGVVTSGSVAALANQALIITDASGGVINATAGSAQIGTLAGATLNTGTGGATVTTLTSGTIVTNGGSVTTQGGAFTGQITGNGGLTMTGTGTLFLNSSNSFTGSTVINAGTVQIAVGDALGSSPAPIRIANNGRFKAMGGVAVTKPVIMSGTSAVYEHVLSGSDSLGNLAPISNTITTADIVAGDDAATTFTSNFNANGSISLHGLNGTKFLMVLDMEGYIPEDATVADYYLGWWDETANSGSGGWVNAVLGNIGTSGSLAGSYTVGYDQFLMDNGGWNGTTMLGAYGLDRANQQVWAVIDHNSDFGVTNNGILLVPEPSTLALAGLGFVGAALGLRRRRRKSDN